MGAFKRAPWCAGTHPLVVENARVGAATRNGCDCSPVDRFVIRRTLLAEVDPDRETDGAASQGVILPVSMSAPFKLAYKCGSGPNPMWAETKCFKLEPSPLLIK